MTNSYSPLHQNVTERNMLELSYYLSNSGDESSIDMPPILFVIVQLKPLNFCSNHLEINV